MQCSQDRDIHSSGKKAENLKENHGLISHNKIHTEGQLVFGIVPLPESSGT